MLLVSCFVILLALSYASSLQRPPSAADHERSYNQTNGDDNWALLIAMSEGYENYRHQVGIYIRVETGSGHPGHPGHILSGSSGSDPLYKLSGSDPDPTLNHVR